MNIVFERTKGLVDRPMHYCSGCSHGIVHRLVAECLVELSVLGKTVHVAPVGCAVMAYDYFNTDGIQAAHGRAAAVATGLKRANPDSIVFTYQGDGDLAAIGAAEMLHAAARGENITVIFVNNAIYGMTGGQMAPTTLPGQVTHTTPYGRDVAAAGHPIKVCELLASLEGSAYLERVAVDTVKNINAAKKGIKKAFETQIAKKGFSMIEIVGICPTNWGLNVQESIDWMQKNLLPYYQLGVYKDTNGGCK